MAPLRVRGLGPSNGSTSVDQGYEAGYTDARSDPDANQRHVGATTYWGARVACAGFPHALVTFRLPNLLDRAPQVSNRSDVRVAGYNPSISDPRVRFWYGKSALDF